MPFFIQFSICVAKPFFFCGNSLYFDFENANCPRKPQTYISKATKTHTKPKIYKKTNPAQSKTLQKHWLYPNRASLIFALIFCVRLNVAVEWCCNIMTSSSSPWSIIPRLSSFRVSQKEASPARVREVKHKEISIIPINLCKFCVVCLLYVLPTILLLESTVHTNNISI